MLTKVTLTLLFGLTILRSTISCDKTGKEKSQIKSLVEQLKKRALPHILPTSVIFQYQNDDLYWFNWLKENSFNLNRTSNHIFKNLQWRQKENIDTIHLEDWSYYKSEYPEFHDTVDKLGRPIIEIWFSDWNIRQAVLSGKSRQLLRWLIYNLEMGMRNLFLLRSKTKSGVSGIIEIMDYSGMNMRTQSCVSCLQIYEALQSVVPQHYPGILEEVIMVNVGSRQNVLLNVWKKTFGTLSATNMSTYGREADWIPVLNSKVSSDQLSIRFGGTKSRL